MTTPVEELVRLARLVERRLDCIVDVPAAQDMPRGCSSAERYGGGAGGASHGPLRVELSRASCATLADREAYGHSTRELVVGEALAIEEARRLMGEEQEEDVDDAEEGEAGEDEQLEMDEEDFVRIPSYARKTPLPGKAKAPPAQLLRQLAEAYGAEEMDAPVACAARVEMEACSLTPQQLLQLFGGAAFPLVSGLVLSGAPPGEALDWLAKASMEGLATPEFLVSAGGGVEGRLYLFDVGCDAEQHHREEHLELRCTACSLTLPLGRRCRWQAAPDGAEAWMDDCVRCGRSTLHDLLVLPVTSPARVNPESPQVAAAPRPPLYGEESGACTLARVRNTLAKQRGGAEGSRVAVRLELDTWILEMHGWSDMDGLGLSQQLRVRLEAPTAFETWHAPSAARRRAVAVIWASVAAERLEAVLLHLPQLIFGVPGLKMSAWRGDRRLRMVPAREVAASGGHADCSWGLTQRAPAPLTLSKDARCEVEIFGVEHACRVRGAGDDAGMQVFADTSFFRGAATSLRDPCPGGNILENFEHHASDCMRKLPAAAMEGKEESTVGILASQPLGQPPCIGANAQVFLDPPLEAGGRPAPQGREARNFSSVPIVSATRQRRAKVPLILRRRWPRAVGHMAAVLDAARGPGCDMDVVEDLGFLKGYAATPFADRAAPRR